LRGDDLKDPADREPPFWQLGGRRLIFSSNHLTARAHASCHRLLGAARVRGIRRYVMGTGSTGATRGATAAGGC
jgi:hypothetical protein